MDTDSLSARTEDAFESGGYADMRPVYRTILRRLKERDAARFEEASKRYEESLVPAIAGGEEEPVAAWATYGAWLAGELVPGRLLRLDESGLATSSDPAPLPGHVLLYLPDESRQPAIPIVLPADPSPAQQAALDLLAR